MCFRTRNCCAGNRRLRRMQGAGAGPRVAEAAARPKGHRLMRGPRARYRAAREIPVRVTVYSPSFGWRILFYPRHRGFPPGGLQAAPTSNPETSTPAQRHGGAKAPALRVTGHLRLLVGWGLDPTAGDRRLLWVCRGGVYAARQHPAPPRISPGRPVGRPYIQPGNPQPLRNATAGPRHPPYG